MTRLSTGVELATCVSTLALPLLSVWRLQFRLTAANAFQAVWTIVIGIPAVLRYAGVETAAKERLFVSTTIANVVLAGAVLATSSPWFRRWTARLAFAGGNPKASRLPRVFWLGVGTSLAIVAIHAALMPGIPLVELVLRSDVTANELTAAREAANKLLPLPLPLKYLLYWNVRVLVPIWLVGIAISGGRLAKLVWFPILIIATSLTLEKSLPFFAIIAAGVGVTVYRRLPVLARPLMAAVLVGVGLAVALQTAVKLREIQTYVSRDALGRSHGSGQPQGSEATVRTGSGVGWRELAVYPFAFVWHRILTVPVDVAYRWFEYFPEVSGGFLYGRPWLVLDRSRPGFEHPAHLVGRHFYYRVDPQHYLETVHAYGAFHADAWANFGYFGVCIASLLVGLVVLVIDVAIVAAASPLGAGAAGAALTILLVTLPGGGLQAALVAQGLIFALLLTVVDAAARRKLPQEPKVRDA